MGFRVGRSQAGIECRPKGAMVSYLLRWCRRRVQKRLWGHYRFKAAPLLLFVVRCQVILGRMLGMFLGMHLMAVRQMRVVGSFFVVVILMMLGGFVVMARSVLMVFRCLLVMMGCFF